MLDLETIQKYAAELGDQIRQLTDFKEKLDELEISVRLMANKQNQELTREVKMLREEVDVLTQHLMSKGMPGINRYEMDLQKMKTLIGSSEWPEAVPPEMIPKNEEDKIIRAETILDIVVTEFLDNVRFLDVGCGEGHVAKVASDRGTKVSVGFDIKQQWKFSEKENLLFTTDQERVKKNAPYDVVLLYDVLDHIEHIDPCDLLQQIKYLLSPSGKVYVRTHPWCSRHGGHLYNKINKAYVHMLFDEPELLRLFGVNSEYVIKLTHPLDIYRKWFKGAGFIVKNETIITKKVDELLRDLPTVVRQRIDSCHVDESNMAIEYVDYVLEAIQSNQQIF